MLSQFRMLGETLSGFRDRMDRIEPQVQQTNEKINILEPAVRSQGADLRAIKSDVATIKSDVATLKSDVGTLKSDTATLRSDVAEIKGDLKGYNQRLEVVEAKLAS